MNILQTNFNHTVLKYPNKKYTTFIFVQKKWVTKLIHYSLSYDFLSTYCVSAKVSKAVSTMLK